MNATQSRKATRQTRRLIKAFIELPPAGRATLYASIMSLSAIQNGSPTEARQWWTVVSLLRPDVAAQHGSHLTPDISKKAAEISQPASHKTQKTM